MLTGMGIVEHQYVLVQLIAEIFVKRKDSRSLKLLFPFLVEVYNDVSSSPFTIKPLYRDAPRAMDHTCREAVRKRKPL